MKEPLDNNLGKGCDGWSVASTVSIESSEFRFMDPTMIADKIDNFDTILLCLQQVFYKDIYKAIHP